MRISVTCLQTSLMDCLFKLCILLPLNLPSWAWARCSSRGQGSVPCAYVHSDAFAWCKVCQNRSQICRCPVHWVLGCICLIFGFDSPRGKDSHPLSTRILLSLWAQDFVGLDRTCIKILWSVTCGLRHHCNAHNNTSSVKVLENDYIFFPLTKALQLGCKSFLLK